MEPAIGYASAGHPMLARVAAEITELAHVFRNEWPSSAPVWLPGGVAPVAGELFRNADLAAFWTRLLDESQAARGRDAVIERARKVFAQGFVAERIDDYLRKARVIDATGERRKGVLTGEDMAGWAATCETPISMDYHGWTVWKCGAWTQGPAFLQALAMLDDPGDPLGADGVHRTVEALKLAFADRDAYLGDPAHSDVPLKTLLSKKYLGDRRREIDDASASQAFRPGRIAGYENLAQALLDRTRRSVPEAGIGTGEPTMAHLTRGDRDTVHIDVIDRWGNAVSVTPSGGWLKSNPVVPGLGVPLGTRAQMFWLDKGLPSTLAPGSRPRTTLTPTMARDPDGGRLVFGTPGGDQQEQWQLSFFARLVHHAMNMQEAIDSPLFHTGHLQASFYPRGVNPGHLAIEPAFSKATLKELERRGHRLEVTEPWAAGRLTAVRRRADGLLFGAATPRLMQAYAVGR